jgi:iron complex outermembrane receptor protein
MTDNPTMLIAPWRALCAGIAALMAAAPAIAADDLMAYDPRALGELSIEQLMDLSVEQVYGASKYQQKLTSAPAAVSIITADEIRRLGHRTLGDVLNSIRGLYVANDRNYSYLGVRGFLRPGDYNSRMLVLIDGHRMNDNIYDSALFGRESNVDVDLIDRVEFIRGPSSSIYGGSAFFGVINVITRRGRDFDGGAVSAEAGSFDAYKASISYGKQLGNDLEMLLSGTWYDSRGQRRLYFPEFDPRISSEPGAANDGIAANADGEELLQFFGRLRYGELSVSGHATTRSKDIPTASYETVFNAGSEATEDNQAYLDLKYDQRFSADLQLLGRVFYDYYTYYGDYPYLSEEDPPSIILYKDSSKGEWLGTELQVTRRLFDRHTLVGGIEYRENLHIDQDYYADTTPRVYDIKDSRSSRILGLFAQGDFSLASRLSLNAGLRYDDYPQQFGGTLNPRLGLIYNPWDSTTFKALYGRAFRPPNAYESYYYSEQFDRPQLNPEKIKTYELVLEQYFGRNTRLNFSAYHYDVSDLIAQAEASDGTLYFENLNQARAFGLEVEAERKSSSGFAARVSYARQRTEDEATSQELSNSPRHLAKLSLIAPLFQKKLFAGLELQYQGSVRTLSGAAEDDFLVGNLNLSAEQLVKGLDASIGVYNLFDTRYGYPGAEEHLQDVIEQDGRSFRLKLTQRF